MFGAAGGRCIKTEKAAARFNVLQVAIAAAGGILPLVKRLALSAPVAQANAAGALWSLAQDVDNQVRERYGCSPVADSVPCDFRQFSQHWICF